MSSAYEDGSPFKVIEQPLPRFYKGWTRKPWMVVVHYSAGFNADDCWKALNNRGLSVHCTIERDGTIHKHVDDANRTIHAGYGRWGGYSNMNHHAFGFEIANLGWLDGVYVGEGTGFLGREVNTNSDGKVYFRRESYTDANGKKKTATIKTETACSRFPDHRPEWEEKYWSLYPQEQIEATFWLIWKWCEAHDILPENVVGHEHVTPHRKQDPGPHFPWTDLKVFLEGRWRQVNPKMIDPLYRQDERIRAVQSHLARLGMPVGDVDGMWGPMTQEAAKQAVEAYGDFYGFRSVVVAKHNCYQIACALRNIPGFDPGRY